MIPLHPFVLNKQPLVLTFAGNNWLCDSAACVPQSCGETLSFAFGCSDNLELVWVELVEESNGDTHDAVTPCA